MEQNSGPNTAGDFTQATHHNTQDKDVDADIYAR